VTKPTELLGVEGRDAAFADPENWEARRYGATDWVPFSTWGDWCTKKCLNDHTQWRRIVKPEPVATTEAILTEAEATEYLRHNEHGLVIDVSSGIWRQFDIGRLPDRELPLGTYRVLITAARSQVELEKQLSDMTALRDAAVAEFRAERSAHNETLFINSRQCRELADLRRQMSQENKVQVDTEQLSIRLMGRVRPNVEWFVPHAWIRKEFKAVLDDALAGNT
jgi:hypothetical protein